MPSTPKNNKCAHLGCKANKSRLNSFCIEHGGLDYYTSPDREKHDAKYKGKAWQVLRTHQLGKQPLCEGCLSQGRVSNAQHVDHLFPWGSINEQAFTYNVFQSLCVECHSYKTGLERKGIIRHFASATDYALSDYAYAVKKLLD